MSRFQKMTRQQIREKIEAEQKELQKHQNRMRQLAPHPFVHEYIVIRLKADDCMEEIAHLKAQLENVRG